MTACVLTPEPCMKKNRKLNVAGSSFVEKHAFINEMKYKFIPIQFNSIHSNSVQFGSIRFSSVQFSSI
jgi:starvation-inducible outer membrane lipoprotein